MFVRQETEADLIEERQIAKSVAAHLGYGLEKINAITYGYDYALTNGIEPDGAPRIIMYLEAKCRDGRNGRKGWTFNSGDGYRIAQHKAERAKLTTATTALDVLLAVRFRDSMIRVANFSRRGDKRIIMAGREPRPNCPNDREPHVIFAWSVWQEVWDALPMSEEDYEWLRER